MQCIACTAHHEGQRESRGEETSDASAALSRFTIAFPLLELTHYGEQGELKRSEFRLARWGTVEPFDLDCPLCAAAAATFFAGLFTSSGLLQPPAPMAQRRASCCGDHSSSSCGAARSVRRAQSAEPFVRLHAGQCAAAARTKKKSDCKSGWGTRVRKQSQRSLAAIVAGATRSGGCWAICVLAIAGILRASPAGRLLLWQFVFALQAAAAVKERCSKLIAIRFRRRRRRRRLQSVWPSMVGGEPKQSAQSGALQSTSSAHLSGKPMEAAALFFPSTLRRRPPSSHRATNGGSLGRSPF